MAKDYAEQLNRIGHKAELLVTRFTTLKEDNERQRARIAELEATVRTQHAELERQRLELEQFRITSAMAPDTATAKQARAVISELVRDIDVCIADLMKEV